MTNLRAGILRITMTHASRRCTPRSASTGSRRASSSGSRPPVSCSRPEFPKAQHLDLYQLEHVNDSFVKCVFLFGYNILRNLSSSFRIDFVRNQWDRICRSSTRASSPLACRASTSPSSRPSAAQLKSIAFPNLSDAGLFCF